MEYLNKIELRGNVGSEPRIKMVGNTKVSNFSLATMYSYTKKDGAIIQETTWHNVSVWGDYDIRKGDIVELSGRLKQVKYTNQEGQEKTFLQVLTQEAKILNR